jgi:ribose transport system permease protein
MAQISNSKSNEPRGFDVGNFVNRFGTVLALIVIFVLFSVLSSFQGGRFLTSQNLINILRQVATLAIVASGLTIAVAAGEFDLSVGQVASLTGILMAGLIVRQELPWGVAAIGALGTGMLAGLITGMLVTRFKIPSLITTLGMGLIAVGVNYAYARGDSIYGRMPEEYTFIGTGTIGPIPFVVIVSAAVVAVLYVFLNYTRTGRYILATGGNPTATRLSGININKYRLIALMISGFCAAMGGSILVSYLGSAQPSGADNYAMDSLAAVFIGMTTIRRGQANILGTIVGVLILGIINNGLNLVGAPFFLQTIVKGSVLILAVSLAVRREEIRFF